MWGLGHATYSRSASSHTNKLQGKEGTSANFRRSQSMDPQVVSAGRFAPTGGLRTAKLVPHVEHSGSFSQKTDKQTEHTKPCSMGRRWQKQDARKSTPFGIGSAKKRRAVLSLLNTYSVLFWCRHCFCKLWRANLPSRVSRLE